ncbi:hypothetical protein H696_00044 [Fonticula alba]|uniref:tRNA-binding domain-containing protein n=1 Tax=Fonticula alba TaxID=691883 RepID=A0A058ZG59_FONAL|nr:hypothetical protein H696_00044 [Fonticula alba]KCV72452.1 hypothetical protein H696_00044 [Fonticula alba]|eukprot:XP_009492153.1 hypothetical protein H696_00044 [Fonticula alba]
MSDAAAAAPTTTVADAQSLNLVLKALGLPETEHDLTTALQAIKEAHADLVPTDGEEFAQVLQWIHLAFFTMQPAIAAASQRDIRSSARNNLPARRYNEVGNLFRWFKEVQDLTHDKINISVFPKIDFEAALAAVAAEAEALQEKKKAKAKPAAKPAAAAEVSGEPDISMLDMRVGRVVSVALHENASSLYVEQIDFGEETGPRTVVSGLVGKIPMEYLQDRLVICLCNLKPAAMRGVKSFAMVMCAANAEDTVVELVEPPAGAEVGDVIVFEGHPGEPLPQLNPKKKIFEALQPGLRTDANRVARWNDIAWSIKGKEGVCAPNTVANGTIR